MTMRPEVTIKMKGRLEAMRIDAPMVRDAQFVGIRVSQGLQFRGGIRGRDKTRTGRPATVVTGSGERGRRKETKTRQRSWREGRGENGRGGSGRGAENSGRAEMRMSICDDDNDGDGGGRDGDGDGGR